MTIEELQHAMQLGIAQKMSIDGSETSSKHLRVGVNSAMCDHAALFKVLFDKDIITLEEYEDARRKIYQREVQMYEKYLSDKLDMQVTLI